MYKLDQRFVKNNRDPEDVAFGAAAKEDGRLFYNDAGFLLALAFADGALYGYDTFADLRQQVIPPDRDEIPLRFKDEVLDLPIARKCTKKDGVTNDPMSQNQFRTISQSSLVNAGYHWRLQIHAIRRQVGKGLDMANCSSVDGQAAFREEESDHRHVEYFQGLEKFRENGLPTRLPAHLEKEVERDPELCTLKAEVQRLRTEGKNQDFTVAQRRLTTHSTRLKKAALDLYQECWIQERRDWIVQSRGRQKAKDGSKTVLAPSIYNLFPERGRLARAMASTHALPVEEMWAALQDLVTLCRRDMDTVYLPGSRPVDGLCPICQRRMKRYVSNMLPLTYFG
ncbi:hypothetical protein A1O1_00943 [Capronia coronata CBS 617.96]|uniref:Uncharacterized protein n=1 Tax=Capronia coronata CBS 617.96 TaxID=1182541 RepID=W9ZMV3_9EURO|nr:uncharacterized protein A1O1_00943 [Capronia coronata CBS 617.96]EXJ95819.1 hypothetical protein A1O1_00943 [Capronia coronata CBS 617.96]